MNIEQIVDEICCAHFTIALGSPGNVIDFEKRTGCRLPTDMSDFYSRIDGARLFDKKWPPYLIFPLRRLCRVGTLITADEANNGLISMWYAFCDVQDGNYIAADLSTSDGAKCDIIECFHESFPDRIVIAASFTSFLLSALASEGRQFWLR